VTAPAGELPAAQDGARIGLADLMRGNVDLATIFTRKSHLSVLYKTVHEGFCFALCVDH